MSQKTLNSLKFPDLPDQYVVPMQAKEYAYNTNYTIGDYCTYQGYTYRCTTSTTGTWDSSKWTLAYAMDEIETLNGNTQSKTLKGTSAPTTSTIGVVGQFYINTSTKKLYVCTAVSGSTYTWSEVSGGGSGSTVSVTQVVTSGTEIATIDVDGVSTPLYAPSGGTGYVVDVQVDGSSVVTKGVAKISLTGKESTGNKVTTISSSSTDTEYPSAKCVYTLLGNIESAIASL